MSNLDELKELSRRLAELLDDPHPGLLTWRQALDDVMCDLAEFGGYLGAIPAKGVEES